MRLFGRVTRPSAWDQTHVTDPVLLSSRCLCSAGSVHQPASEPPCHVILNLHRQKPPILHIEQTAHQLALPCLGPVQSGFYQGCGKVCHLSKSSNMRMHSCSAKVHAWKVVKGEAVLQPSKLTSTRSPLSSIACRKMSRIVPQRDCSTPPSLLPALLSLWTSLRSQSQ